MKKYVYFGILALIGARAGVSALHPLSARAAEPPQIVIGEINWGGSKTSTADEWLEIANTSNTDVDLSNWYFTGIGTSGGIITLPQGSMIKAESTFLIANYNLSDAKTTLNVLPDYVTTAVSIPNSSLNVHLFMPDGTETDSYVDTSTPDYGSTSPMTSIERNLVDLSWKSSVSNSGLLDQTQLGTPGSAVFPVVEVISTATEEVNTDVTASITPDESTPVTPPLSEGDGATPDATLITESIETPVQLADVTSETTIEEPVLETTVQAVDPIPTETVEPSMTDVVIEETVAPVEQQIPTDEQIGQSPVIETAVTETPNAVGTVEVTPVADTAATVTETVTTEPTVISTTTTVETTETNPEPSPVVIPSFSAGSLTINELLPSPDDRDEWVEIFNPGSTDITLTGWTLKDASGKITKLEETSFKSHSFLVVTNPSGKLNNSGDTVTLFDPSNNVIDSVVYGTPEIPAPKKGVALARDANGTWGTTTPTPGATNVFPDLTPTNSVSLSSPETGGEPTTTTTTPTTNPSTSSYVTQPNNTETTVGALGTTQSAVGTSDHVSSKPAKTAVRVEPRAKAKASLKKSSLITLEGTVIVPPNVFGKQIAFLNGLELYFNKANWPDLPVGTHIKVTGTMSESNGNKRLKIAKAEDIVVLGTAEATVTPVTSITDQPHGTLIAFSGTVADKKGSTLTVILASGEAVPVIIPKGVPLSAKLLTAGSIVDVTGVLKRKDGAWTVALRSADDITLSSTTPLPTPLQGGGEKAIAATSSNMPIVGGGLLTSTLGALGYWYAKSKGLSLLTLIKM